MFTGIIETTGIVREIIPTGTNRSFWIQSRISDELKIDQSLSHDGVCLTVEEIDRDRHRVTAIEETLYKTTLGSWQAGSKINLERSMKLGDRLDGHIVQGHVDCTAVCQKIRQKEGSLEMKFEFPEKFNDLVIEKGSISLNGISLTIFKVKNKSFRVAIIPYTLEHTNLKELKVGDSVNIEFDVIGKYINRQN
jgi:riboflavin synthase